MLSAMRKLRSNCHFCYTKKNTEGRVWKEIVAKNLPVVCVRRCVSAACIESQADAGRAVAV